MGIKFEDLPDGSVRLSFPRPVSGLTLKRANRIAMARRLLEGLTEVEKMAAVFKSRGGSDALLAKFMGMS